MIVVGGSTYLARQLKLPDTRGAHVTFCPFHPNSHTPAFSVDLDDGLWYCHGGCQGGDALTFYIRMVRQTDGRTLTRDEANDEFLRGRDYRGDTKQALYETEVRLFYLHATPALEDLYRLAHAPLPDLSMLDETAQWDVMEARYDERTELENLLAIATSVPLDVIPSPLACAFFERCKAEGIWTREDKARFTTAAHQRTASYRRRLADGYFAKHYASEVPVCPPPVAVPPLIPLIQPPPPRGPRPLVTPPPRSSRPWQRKPRRQAPAVRPTEWQGPTLPPSDAAPKRENPPTT